MFSTMVATPHMLVGAAVALKARSVKGGVAIGILSHLALDAVPHSEYRLGALGGLVLGADLAGGTLAVSKLSGGSEVVLAGALGGVLPDIVRFAEGVLDVKIARRVHDPIHTDSDPPLWAGIATQGLTVAIAALALRTAARRAQACSSDRFACDLTLRLTPHPPRLPPRPRRTIKAVGPEE